MSDNPAGWQPDPTGKHDHRYWDGTQWTDNVADAGVASTEAYEPVDAEAQPDAAPDAPTVVTPAPGDDTSTYPTPPVPPPYVPPTPVATSGDGSGGSKRPLLIGGAILAAVALAVIAFLALGGDDDDTDVRAQLAGAIGADEDLDVSSDQADCIADLVVDEAGEDAFDDTDFTAEDPPPEFIAAVAAIGFDRIAEECDLDGEAAFGGSGDPTDSNGDSGDSGDSGEDVPTDGFNSDELEDVYRDTYESMGLTEDQAECLTDRVLDAIESGDLSEDQAVTEFLNYLEDCDISLEDLSGN